jgi:hypothetical protein
LVEVALVSPMGWLIASFVLAAVLILCVAMARAHGRRMEHRVAAELGRRWELQISTPPDPELQITLDELLAQRNELLEQFQEVQEQIRELRTVEARRRLLYPVEDVSNVIMLRDEGAEEENARGS